YSEALRLEQDPEAYSHRGWAHLQMDAPRSALADFALALTKGPRTFGPLCGRGMAQVRLGQVKEAVADVSEAVRKATKAEERRLLRGRSGEMTDQCQGHHGRTGCGRFARAADGRARSAWSAWRTVPCWSAGCSPARARWTPMRSRTRPRWAAGC